MNRRSFLNTSALSAAALQASSGQPAPYTYKLRYAPHVNMGGWHQGKLSPEEQLAFFAQWGFKAFEYNGLPSRTPQQMESLRKKMDDLKMSMGVMVVNRGGWKATAMPDKQYHATFLEDVKRALEIHKIVGNECATVCSGVAAANLTYGEQTKNCIEALKRAAEIVAGSKLVLVLEPLNIRVDHAGYFVVHMEHAAEIISGVNSPNVKIVMDLYHQQISEGNLINHLNRYWDLIGSFQTGDVPGRREPDTGEVNWQNVFKAIHKKGTEKILGMEHGLSERGEAGLIKCFNAYRKADNWPA